jgi:hypothetical protein
MKGEAKFSDCGRWRWWLWREWDEKLPVIVLIGMNPSTADADKNDPTVAKEVNYATSWGFGGMLKLNAFAFKATNPKDMWAAKARGVDIIGAENTAAHMIGYMRYFRAERAVACWGRLKSDRGWLLAEQLKLKLDCLRKNSDGSPAHPLYLPYGLLLEPWNY